ncbi:MAG: GBS Bsp-like repeat-containing protein [Lachnospiraceae bacterium]|nr:GBS Bsp-like repeat-containing protein [Lachnospiraceae bacterium]
MKKWMKGVSMLLVAMMLFTIPGIDTLAVDTSVVATDNASISTTEQETEINDNTVPIVPEDSTTSEAPAADENIEKAVVDPVVEPTKAHLSYVYLDKQIIHVPDTQHIAIGFAETEANVESAILTYSSTITGQKYTSEATSIIDNALLFTQEYAETQPEDEYQLESLSYHIIGDEEEYSILFADEAISASFKVTKEAAVSGTTEDAVPEVTAYAVNNNGEIVPESSGTIEDVVESTLDKAENTVGTSEPVTTSKGNGILESIKQAFAMGNVEAKDANGNLVVALSAGHDSTHSGASTIVNGTVINEADLNLAVAQFCKAELEQYSGVTVYMTRTSAACPNPGMTKGQDNNARIDGAVANGADVYVDIHFNSGGGTGAEIFYPNTSYNAAIGTTGEELAQKIMTQLTALGLANRGTQTKDATDGETDSNGVTADYYTTNNYCKEKGIPGIIVEHAFIDNATDGAKLYNADGTINQTFMKSLGVADATGIAQKYGLTKDNPKVSIINKNDFTGTFTVSATGLNSGSLVKAYVWGAGQASTDVCYIMENKGGGKFSIDVNKSSHKGFTGTYYVAIYYGTNTGVKQPELASASIVLKNSSAVTVVNYNGTQAKCDAVTTITSPPSDLKSIKYAVWPAGKGLKWYTATQSSSTVWNKTINIADFMTYGNYYVDSYAEYNDGRTVYLNTSTFSIVKPTLSNIAIENLDSNSGTFNVVARGVSVPTGISNFRVAVWPAGKAAQWYTFTKVSDGVYSASVNAKDFGYATGMYYSDVYLTDGIGITSYMGGNNCDIRMTNASVSATDSSSGAQKTFLLKANNVSALYGVTNVKFAVWRTGNGVKWYNASQEVTGAWYSTVNVSDFQLTGKYYADAYVTTTAGNMICCGSTTFNVSAPNVGLISIENQNNSLGTFDVIVKGLASASGIQQVKIPVWKEGAPITWYTAQKKADGSYVVNVNIKDHAYALGKYHADVYVVDGNNTTTYMGGSECTMIIPAAQVTATDTAGTQKQFNLVATNVATAMGVKKVEFAVWRANSAAKWYTAVQDSGTGAWCYNVNISDFKLAGAYYVDMYITTNTGEKQVAGSTTFTVAAPTATSISITDVNSTLGTFKVVISGVATPSGISKIQVPIWLSGRGVVWYTATKQSEGVYSVDVDVKTQWQAGGKYYADVYVTDGNGCQSYIGGANTLLNYSLYAIMGNSSASVAQMVSYYNATSSIAYPSTQLSAGGASTLTQFCQIYLEEAAVEGVKAEVAFAQAMLETGFLKFGGDVSITQYNFAGLGATGGVPGNSFPDVRTGIRAQIQHLKCYASSDALNQATVDQRWSTWLRSKAPFVEWLSIPNNPYGTGWATDINYGTKLLKIIATIKAQ